MRIVSLIIILFYSCIGLSSTFVLKVNSVDKGTLVDLYGLPNALELELVVELMALPMAEGEYFIQQQTPLFKQISEEHRRLLMRLPLKESLEDGQAPSLAYFKAEAIIRSFQEMNPYGESGKPYLRISLMEKSKNAVCFFEKCNVNFTDMDLDQLQNMKLQVVKDLVSKKLNEKFYFAHESLFKHLSVSEMNRVDSKLDELWHSRNLIPLEFLVNPKINTKISEPFWLQNSDLFMFDFLIEGEIKQVH